MLIDWFTVVAQGINFLILMWLMRRFLYQPVLDAIDRRESRIAAELADADARKVEAHEERDEFQRKSRALDAERADLMRLAQDDADQEGQRLLEEARLAAAALDVRHRVALESQANELHQTLARRAQSEIFAIAGQVLGELAGASVEERATVVFTQRLGELDDATRAELVDAIGDATVPGRIRSAFELDEGQRAAVQVAFREALSVDLELVFETAPDLVSGIEFSCNGKKVSWNIADYLAALQSGAAEVLGRQVRAEVAP